MKQNKKSIQKAIKNFQSSEEFQGMLKNPLIALYMTSTSKDIEKSIKEKSKKYTILKAALNVLIKEVNPISALSMTEYQLHHATIMLMRFLNDLQTHDNAPEHKKVKGLKIYATRVHRLNKSALFLNAGIEFLTKAENSSYMNYELVMKLKNYPGTYTHTYVPNKNFILLNKILSNLITAESVKFTELFSTNKLSSIELQELKNQEDSYFSIDYMYYLRLQASYTVHIIKGTDDKFEQAKMIFMNVLGVHNGSVIINNKTKKRIQAEENGTYVSDKFNRQYSIYALLKTSLREFIHPDRTEVDMDSAVFTMFCNLNNSIDKQDKVKWAVKTENKFGKIVPKFHLKKGTLQDMKFEYPYLNSMLKDKDIARLQVKSALGTDIKGAKQFITSIAYDPFKHNILFHENSKGFGIINKKEIMFTKGLIKDINSIMRKMHSKVFKENKDYDILGYSSLAIRDKISKDIEEDKRLNPNKYGRGKKRFGKEMSRLYFFMEAVIRKHVLYYYQSHNPNSEILQIHDCVVIPSELRDVSHTDLTKALEKKFKYYIKFS